MLNLLKKSVKKTSSTDYSDGEEDYNPLSHIRIVNDAVTFVEGGNLSGEDNDNLEASGRLHDTVMRLYGPERFTRHVCGVMGWVGRKKGLQSLQVSEADEDFAAALGVIHRRLMDGPAGEFLNHLSDQAFEDLLIIAVGVGPVAVGAFKEVADKKKGGSPQGGPPQGNKPQAGQPVVVAVEVENMEEEGA